jgi:enoyl-CoA hydratase
VLRACPASSLLRCSEPAARIHGPTKESRMPKVIYEKDDRIGRITLNRPEVMNAIDDDVPVELADCVARANADPAVHVIVLAGAGEAFCAGYDLTYYAQGTGGGGVTQKMPWDPMKDYAFMMRNTELFMSLCAPTGR